MRILYFFVTHHLSFISSTLSSCRLACNSSRSVEKGWQKLSDMFKTNWSKLWGNMSGSWHLTWATLQWRHNERDGVSNHQPHDCLFSWLFRRKSKKISKLRVTGLCVGNSPVTGEFPAQMAGDAKNVSIWVRHHEIYTLNAQQIFSKYTRHLDRGGGGEVVGCFRSLKSDLLQYGINITL